MKQYLPATLKSLSDTGAFVAIASMPTLDRDEEVIAPGAFLPLPRNIPVLFSHRTDDPVGRAVPRYDRDTLLVEGTFGSSARAQEVRGMVIDGTLASVSVGFMDAKRETRSGIPTIVSAELLEVSFVSIPSNREASVLSVRSYQSGRLSPLDQWKIRIAALEAEIALLPTDSTSVRAAPVSPLDVRAALADAKALLSDLSRQDR